MNGKTIMITASWRKKTITRHGVWKGLFQFYIAKKFMEYALPCNLTDFIFDEMWHVDVEINNFK